MNNSKSNQLPIKYGVPQGSVLGPILFSLYINDIKELGKQNEVNLFADDTSLFCVAKNYNELERKSNIALEQCNKWLTNNRLTINTDKTHFLDFSVKKTSKINLYINGVQIEEKNETKYLGLIIQNDLKWEQQIKKVISKLNNHIPLYLILRNIISIDKRKLIYR